jgi:hypothetical protein
VRLMRRQTAEKEQYTPLLSLIWMGDTNRIKYSPAAAPTHTATDWTCPCVLKGQLFFWILMASSIDHPATRA